MQFGVIEASFGSVRLLFDELNSGGNAGEKKWNPPRGVALAIRAGLSWGIGTAGEHVPVGACYPPARPGRSYVPHA